MTAPQILPKPESTYQLLLDAATAWPDGVATQWIPDPGDYTRCLTWTYAELANTVTRIANALTALGVGRPDAVTLSSVNTSVLYAATLAAQAAGIAAPVNPALSGERIAGLIRRTGSRVMVAAGPELDPQAWPRLLEVARQAGMSVVLALRPDGAHGDPPALDEHGDVSANRDGAARGLVVAYLDDVIAGQPSGHLACADLPAAGDIAAFVPTGGTTGAPKIAAHTHANQLACGHGIAQCSGLAAGEAMLGGLPLFHVNALIVTGIAPMFSGARVVWPGPAGYRDPALYARFWKIVEHYRIAAMSAVPTVYGALAQVPVDADISSLRLPIVGAAPLPSSVRADFARHTGRPLLEGYGLTEATCASTWTRPGEERAGSVGRALPGQRIKTVRIGDDGSWADCAPGEAGVLAIGGPAVFAGYVTDPALGGPRVSPEGVVRDGWLNTGDLGSVDADGFVYLTGRAKDLIIRGGHNIDPRVIEEALLRHPAVRHAAAVGRPDRHSGEIPVAYVVPAGPGRFDEAELLGLGRRRDRRARRPAETHLPGRRDPGHRGGQAVQARAGRRRRRPRGDRRAGRGGPGRRPRHRGARARAAGRHRDRRRPRPGPRRPRRIRPHRPPRAVAGWPNGRELTIRKADMTVNIQEPVIVVGAGPVGCTAALLLADLGIPVTLLERHTQPHPQPRAVHLDDEVARTLDRIGVSEQFLARSRPGSGLRLLDARHRVLAEFRREQQAGPHGFPQANMFHQPDLEELMLSRVEEHPLISFHRGAEVSGMDGTLSPLTADPVRVHARVAGEPARRSPGRSCSAATAPAAPYGSWPGSLWTTSASPNAGS